MSPGVLSLARACLPASFQFRVCFVFRTSLCLKHCAVAQGVVSCLVAMLADGTLRVPVA